MKITYLPEPETEIMALMFTIVIITRIESFFSLTLKIAKINNI